VHTTTPSFFPWDEASWDFLLGLAWSCNPPNVSLLQGWDDRHVPLHPAISWDGVSWTVCLGWPQTVILLIYTSQIARIIALSQHVWPEYPAFLWVKIINYSQKQAMRRIWLVRRSLSTPGLDKYCACCQEMFFPLRLPSSPWKLRRFPRFRLLHSKCVNIYIISLCPSYLW
jgi:hypothetical protein